MKILNSTIHMYVEDICPMLHLFNFNRWRKKEANQTKIDELVIRVLLINFGNILCLLQTTLAA